VLLRYTMWYMYNQVPLWVEVSLLNTH
jgi:hypothetical protein